MHKKTYDKKKRGLLNGDNFAVKKLAALEAEVMDYTTMAVGQYQLDGNVDHVKAGAILLTSFNRKWVQPFFKAMRQIRALHTDFKIVVTPDAVAFSYAPIPKDKRPEVLPELQEVLEVMLTEFVNTQRSRPGKTDAEKEEAATKSLVTNMLKPGRFEAALTRLSVEELARFADIFNDVVTRRAPEFNSSPTPAPAPASETAEPEAKPATPAQLEELAEKLAA